MKRAVRQARLQWEAMRTCRHKINHDQRCERCMAPFWQTDAQRAYLREHTEDPRARVAA